MREIIDEKVVEMRFDNAQFERETKNTLSTLTKLKKALKFPDGAKGLEDINEISKKISLKNIEQGVTSLSNRFNFLGRTVMKITDNIRDALTGKLKSSIDFVTDSIVSGGLKRSMNIENAHFQLQALLKDETKVQAVMSDAMDSVDGTAYAYDEAAKAASQFSASGVQAGKEMRNALQGITGVAAMTNSSFEDIARVFTTVAGNGRLMGDQLLQLSSRGLNAASTIAEYYREVKGLSNTTEAEIRQMVTQGKISFKEFSDAMTWAFGDSAKRANETLTGSFSNTKAALARIGAGFFSPFVEQNGELVKLFNVLIKKTNAVKSELVFDEQRSAIKGLAYATKMSEDNISELFDIIKKEGHISIGNLNKLNESGINATKSLTKYMKGVKNGSIRSTYAIKTLIDKLSKDGEITSKKVEKWVKKGKIDLSTFTSAMEKEYGKEKTLSKRFVDFFQDKISALSKAVEKADLSVPIKLLEKSVSITSNTFKGFYNILKPVIKALKDSLPAFDSKKILKFASAIEKLTSKLKLSKKQNQELYDAFKGIFDVVRMLVVTFGKMLGIISPMSTPVQDLGNSLLSLAGAMGRNLSAFSKWIEENPVINTSLKLVGKTVQNLFKVLSNLFNLIAKTSANKDLNEFKYALLNFIPEKALNGITFLGRKFKELANSLKELSLNSNIPLFKAFGLILTKIEKTLSSNDGLNSFINGIKEYIARIKDGVLGLSNFNKSIENASNRTSIFGNILSEVFGIFKDFRNFIIEKFQPAVSKIDFSNAFAVGGGALILVAMTKIFKVLNHLSNFGNNKGLKALTSLIPNLNRSFNSFSKVMNALSTSIHADSIYKISKAIAILAGSILLLSFADVDKVKVIGIVLSSLIASILFGWAALTAAEALLNKSKDKNPLNKLIDFVGDFVNSATRLVERLQALLTIKVITSSLTNVAKSIMIIVGSLAAIWYLYKKDVDALNKSIVIIGTIWAVMVGLIVMFNHIAKNPIKGAEISGLMKSVVFLSAALAIMVSSIVKLFKMELPNDYGKKLVVLGGLILGLGSLVLIISAAARIAKGNALTGLTMPLLSISTLLTVLVKSITTIFKIDLPTNWAVRLGILTGMIYGVIKVVSILTVLSLLSGRSSTLSKNVGSLALLLISSTFSLSLLFKMKIPDDWEKRISILKSVYNSLIGLIIIMGVVSKLGGGTFKAGGTIAAMALVILSTTISLYALALLPFDKLLKGAISLGIVLTALGISLAGAGKIIDGSVYKSVLSLAVVIGAITIALGVLSTISVQDLKKSCTALGSMLILIAGDFLAISKMTNDKVWKNVLMLAINIAAIGGTLYVLAGRDWNSLLAAGTALSLSLVAVAGALVIMNNAKIDLSAIGKFALAAGMILIVTAGIAIIAQQPWQQIIAAAAGLSLALLATSAAIAIMGVIPVQPTAIISYLGAILVVGTVAFALYQLCKYPMDTILAAAKGLSLVLLALTVTIAILGNIPAYAGIAAAANIIEFVGLLALALWYFGTKIGDPSLRAAIELGLEGLQTIAYGLGKAISMFAEGIVSSLPKIADSLSEFGEKLQPFINAVNLLNESSARGCLYLAAMFAVLTASSMISGFTNLLSFGQGGLKKVGSELASFGPKITEFADTVKDVDEDSVKGAAAAALAMMKVAEAAPGFMGLKQFIFGTKSLAEFGAELVLFGPSIALFARIVKDVDEDSVKGAAAAGEVMAKLADTLPPVGGLAQVIFGSKSLAEFGAELVAFGPYIALFSAMVKDIDADSVNGAAAAGATMAELANNLPEDKNFFQNLFGGGQTSIDKFGKQLVAFATSMLSFSKIAEDVQYQKIDGIIQNVKDIIDLNDYVTTGSSEHLVVFLRSLEEIPTTCIDNFVYAFEHADKKINSSIKTFGDIIQKALKDVTNKTKNQFSQSGNTLVNSFSNNMLKTSKSAYIATTNSGLNVAKGYLVGLNDKDTLNKIAKSGTNTAKTIDFAFRNYMGIHSPATRMIENAIQCLRGTTKGLADPQANKELAKMSFKVGEESVVTPMEDSVNSGMEDIADNADFNVENIIESYADGFTNNSDILENIGGIVPSELTSGLVKQNYESTKVAYSEGAKLAHAYTLGVVNADKEANERKYFDMYASMEAKEERRKKEEQEEAKRRGKMYEDMYKPKEPEEDEYTKWLKEFDNDLKIDGFDTGQDWSNGLADGISSGSDGISSSANKASSAANKEADKNTKKLEKVIKNNLKGTQKAIKDNAENLVKEDDKFWLKLLRQHQKGADKEQYKDMQLKEFKKKMLNEISELYNNYAEKYESTVKNIMSTTDLFASKTKETIDSARTSIDILSDVSTSEIVDKYKIMGNIAVTKDMADEYVEIMNSLSTRIKGTELYEYLRKIGYKNVDQLRIFNEMTEEELQVYVNQYKELGNSISNASIFESDPIPVVDIVANLKDDLEAKEEYIKLQKALRERFKDTDFLDYVKDISLNDIDKLRKINELSESETEEMLKTYTENLEASMRIASLQLEDDRNEMEQQISDLLGLKNVKINMNDFEKNFDGSMKSLTKYVNESLLPLENAFPRALDRINKSIADSSNGNAIAKNITNVLQGAINGFKSIHAMSENKGKDTTESYAKGLKKSNSKVKKSVTDINDVMEKTLNNPNKYYGIGNNITTSLNAGLSSMIPAIQNTASIISALMSKILSLNKTSSSISESFGNNVVQGYTNGITSNIASVYAAATGIATATTSAIQSALKIHSPSKVTEELANYTGLGFINTLLDYVSKAGQVGEKIADSTYDGMSRVVIDDFTDPVIRPTVDMSGVDSAIDRIRERFNNIVIGTTFNADGINNTIRKSKVSDDTGNIADTKDNSGKEINITYQQYNNSPKALSRFEIYRQTQNQLNQLKTKGVNI